MAARISQIDLMIGGNADVAVNQLKRVDHETMTLFQRIKEKNAESRASGEIAFERLLRGGGALGLMTFGSEALKKMAEDATKAMEQVRAGQISVGEGWLEFSKGIPIVGGLISTFETLGKAIRSAAGLEDFEQALKEVEAQGKKIEERAEYFRKRGDEHALAALEGGDKKKEEIRQRSTRLETENNKKRAEEMADLAKAEAKARQEIEDNSRSYAGLAGQGAYEAPQATTARQEATAKAEADLIRFAEERKKIVDKYGKEDGRVKEDSEREISKIDREAKARLNENTLKSMDTEIKAWGQHRKQLEDGARHHANELAKIGDEEFRKQGERTRQTFEQTLKEHHDQSSVEGDLAKLKIESVMEKGNTLEADRLTIAEKYREEREHILKILQDENATAGQKVRASRLGDELDSRERAALTRAAGGGSQATGFGFESAQFLTGVAGKDSSGEKLADVANNTEPVPALLQTIATKLDGLMTAFSKKPATYSGN